MKVYNSVRMSGDHFVIAISSIRKCYFIHNRMIKRVNTNTSKQNESKNIDKRLKVIKIRVPFLRHGCQNVTFWWGRAVFIFLKYKKVQVGNNQEKHFSFQKQN